MAEGMMNDPNAMGGQPPMGQPPMGNPMGGQPDQTGAVNDAVLDMHLTEDVKNALSAKGVDISAVADRGPTEPVVVIPDILSKNESLIEKSKSERRKGIEPKDAIVTHANVENKNVCLRFN